MKYNRGNAILLIPGSFNPLHRGHIEIAAISNLITKLPPIFLVSAKNADKLSIDITEGIERCSDIFKNYYFAFLCFEPLFVDKIRKYSTPNKTLIFAIGYDTWERLWDEKYGVSNSDLTHLLRIHSVKFLVFPRNGKKIESDNEFVIRHELVNDYYNDVSSTQLRNNLQ